ncbi:MAG TPA: cobalamin-binding protein [Thermoplasmata archaeon]|nr:cobalamin-binding protein [Thermoplasmata archaeon]
MRIVSVLPSATEIVCDLGARRSLVGRSSECDYPDSVRQLPEVMRPRVDDRDRPSSEIDRRVQQVRADAQSLYDLDIELLRKLRPELLITQDLCSVCSVTEEEAARACRTAGVEPKVLSISPRTLPEVWRGIRTVGRAIGRPASADRRIAAIQRTVAGRRGPRRARRATVAIVEWIDPPILAGLWASQMASAAGLRSVGPRTGEVGERTDWAEIAERGPDLVVVSPCSFTVERTRAELGRGRAVGGLRSLAPSLGTWLADEAFFSRPGPRLAWGVALLRGLAGSDRPRVPIPFERWDAASPRP